ncbi:hypothetical protein IWX91DRAFT_399297, partial [Phyllosticta citricarpa]
SLLSWDERSCNVQLDRWIDGWGHARPSLRLFLVSVVRRAAAYIPTSKASKNPSCLYIHPSRTAHPHNTNLVCWLVCRHSSAVPRSTTAWTSHHSTYLVQMLCRFLAHQESHYAYADVCIHPHPAGSATMSTQPEAQQKRIDEEEKGQVGSSKAREEASNSPMAPDATPSSNSSSASGVGKTTGDGAGNKVPAAAVAGPARMIGPQVKGAETAVGRGRASQKRALSARALDVDLVNLGM